MQCDMCGSEGKLFKALIEGTELNVCSSCSRYGKAVPQKRDPPVMAKHPNKSFHFKKEPQKEIVELITEDYAGLIKDKREKLGLKQEQLAKKMAERESLVQKVESGHIEPSLALARKFERFLGLKLIEKYEESKDSKFESSKADITIGDVINIRRRK